MGYAHKQARVEIDKKRGVKLPALPNDARLDAAENGGDGPRGATAARDREDRIHRSRPRIKLRYIVAIFLCCSLGFAASWEARTSDLQSWFFHRWSSTLHYSIEGAANPQIAFPRSGPFDERHGYTLLPKFTERLQTYGFHISAQASQTPQLAKLIHDGIAPPYREAPVAGLVRMSVDHAMRGSSLRALVEKIGRHQTGTPPEARPA